MVITLLGLSHRTAPVALRERLTLPESAVEDSLKALHERAPEGMIYSTCNRFEVLAQFEDLDTARETLVDFISSQRNIPRQEFEQFLYFYAGPDAVRHVFRVTSSLDSMVVGEPQILGQMKQFFSIAQKEKTVGVTLNSLVERAFMVAKKVRTETQIATNPVSVSSVAVELACKIFSDLEGKTALIVGAGKMSVLSIKHLQSRGIRSILVTNRTFQKAAEIAEQVQGRAVPFEDLSACLAESDIVISSTGSPHFIIRKEDVQRAISQRRNRPIFLMDIAVPRDIDPQVNKLDNVFLYDIDDLKTVVERNRQERAKEAEKAEEIVAKETETFWGRLKALDVAPTIREIQNRIDALRANEMERTMKKLGPITEEQRKAIEQLTSSLTSKILQTSYSELRHLANHPDSVEKIELIKKLFRL